MLSSTPSIPPSPDDRQVIELNKFRCAKQRRDNNMSEEIARLKASFSESSTSTLKEARSQCVLQLIAESNGTTITKIRHILAERKGVDLSYPQVKRVLKKLEQEGWCKHIEEVQAKTGIKPIHIYYLASTLDPMEIIYALDEVTELRPKSDLAIVSQPRVISDDPYMVLTGAFEQLRLTAREDHFILMALVGQGVTTMNTLASLTGSKNQSTHTRLTKLIEYNLLGREKRDSGSGLEYHYFLDSGITKEHLSQFALENGFLFPSVNPQIKPEAQYQEVEMSSQQSSSVSDSANKPPIREKLLEHLPSLPSFDPTWSDEVKADWLKAYRQITELVQKNS